MADYSKISLEDFTRLLRDIVADEDVLSVPGIYEVLSEHFNNEVLRRWRLEQEDDNGDTEK